MSGAPGRALITAAVSLLILIWGTTWATIRISLLGFPPLIGLALRFAVSAVVLLVAARLVGVELGKSRLERRLWPILAVLTCAGPYAIIYWSEQWVPSGLASVLFATFPLFAGIVAYVLLPGERLGTIGILGLLTGFAGVVVIFSDDLEPIGGPQVLVAALVMLISPFLASIGQAVVKRWGKDIHPLSLTAPPMALAALFLVPFAWMMERGRPVEPSLGPVLAVLYLAIFGTAITFFVYFWLLSYISTTRLSLLTYAVPVLAVAIGTLALDEPLTLRMVGGTLLILAGAVLVIRPKKVKDA